MRLDAVCTALDAYFRTADVRGDDWSEIYDSLYPEPYWREFAEPGYDGHWNGLLVRSGAEVERAATCVFPSDAIVAALRPRTLLFSEHPIAYEDDVEGFAPLACETFERLRGEEISFYHVHAPLDQHPKVAPSRLVAEGVGLVGLEEYFPIAEGIPGGAAVIGNVELTLDELAGRLRRTSVRRSRSTSSPVRASVRAELRSSRAGAPTGRSSSPRSSAAARRTSRAAR